jgi:UDP-glucose 4,6-dehydratase
VNEYAASIVVNIGLGEVYNIGTQYEITNLGLAQELIRRFAEANGQDVATALKRNIVFVSDRALNDRRYAVNCSKLHALGWSPRVDFETGIRKTSK